MIKKCETCIHYPICKTWTQADYRCGLYEAVPPCKVGDKLYIPIYDEIDDEGWCVDVLPINDVGQRYIYCPYSPSNENDVSDTFAIDRIGQDVFLSMDEAVVFIEAVKRGEQEMNEIKLKPCPFCGGEAKLTQVRGDNHDFWADGLFFIESKHIVNPPNYICPLYYHRFGHYGGGYDKKAERYSDVTIKAHKACEEWNRRAEDEREGKAD